jgi:hypothetical protein
LLLASVLAEPEKVTEFIIQVRPEPFEIEEVATLLELEDEPQVATLFEDLPQFATLIEDEPLADIEITAE